MHRVELRSTHQENSPYNMNVTYKKIAMTKNVLAWRQVDWVCHEPSLQSIPYFEFLECGPKSTIVSSFRPGIKTKNQAHVPVASDFR